MKTGNELLQVKYSRISSLANYKNCKPLIDFKTILKSLCHIDREICASDNFYLEPSANSIICSNQI